VDTLKDFRSDVSRIMKRTLHRGEYASGLTSLLIILTLIVLVRFGANIYLFLSLRAGGAAVLNVKQIWGGMLFAAVHYVIAGAFIQGFKINRFLTPSAAVFQTSRGRRLFSRLKTRVLVYRPLLFGIFAVLFCFAVLLSVLFGGDTAWFVWLYFVLAAAAAFGGYIAVAALSGCFRLEEFESRLMEVLFLSVLVFSNPDFVSTENGLMLGFFLMPLPFGRLPLWLAGVLAAAAAAVLLIAVFRIGSTIFTARSVGGSGGRAAAGFVPPLSLKLYGKILKPRFWLLLFAAAVLVSVNQHLQARQKLLTVIGISATAVLTFTIFLFSLDIRLREAWHISPLKREHVGLFILPLFLHLLLSAIPYLLYRVLYPS
jgi:hypothetical protein